VTGRVAWIGLGEMGLPMAGHLVAAGYEVVGFDLDPARALEGAERAASAAEAVSGADVAVSMVRTGSQTEELLATIAEAVDRPLDVIIMSTIEPELAAELARRHAGRLTLIDSPVSGGVRGAEAATLAIMTAGPPDALERVRPILDALGSSVFVLGDEPGLGQAAKVANQVMMGAALAGTMEGLALARSYGLEDGPAIDAVLAGTGASWVLDHWDWMRSLWEEYEPGNALDILIKDLRATAEAGERRGVPLPSTALALQSLLEQIA
jgi:3-hydroxyisobutyrate dehydrogenase-like beta-hydroxyacid dehydrogenase